MATKTFIVLFIQAVLSKAVLSQCLGAGIPGPCGPGWGYDGLAYDGLGLAPFDTFGMGPYDAFPLAPLDAYGPGWPGLGCGAPFGMGPFGPGPFGPGPIAPGPFGPGPVGPAMGPGYAGYGGPLPVSAGSPMPPSGLSILSENVIEGVVSVAGQLPFLSAVSMSGEFPTAGVGAVSYGCGDGFVGMMTEAPMAPTMGSMMGPMVPAMGPMEFAGVGPYGYGPVIDSMGYGMGPIAGCGYGPYY